VAAVANAVVTTGSRLSARRSGLYGFEALGSTIDPTVIA
jgi:hypothetical protein